MCFPPIFLPSVAVINAKYLHVHVELRSTFMETSVELINYYSLFLKTHPDMPRAIPHLRTQNSVLYTA